MATGKYYCEAGVDDAMQSETTNQVTVTGVGITLGGSSTKYIGAWRFKGTSALAGTTINTAHMHWKCGQASTGTVACYFEVQAEAAPEGFVAVNLNITTGGGGAARTYMPVTVDQPFTVQWYLDTVYQSVDFAPLLQQLVSAVTPTDIVIKLAWSSGTGSRRIRTFESSPSFRTWLDVEYTAEAAPQDILPPVVTVAATVLVPDITPGSVTLDAPLITARAQVLVPTLTPGDYTMEPPVVTAVATTLAPTLTPESVTFQAPVAIAKAVVLVPSLTTTGAAPQTFTLPVVTAKAVALVPTLTPGAVTVTAPLVTAKAVAKIPTLTPGIATMTPPVVTARAIAYAPQILPGSRTMSPPVATVRAQIATPTLTTTGVATYKWYRDKSFVISATDYPSGTQFYFVAYLWTQNVSKPCHAFLYDTVVGQKIVLSEVTSISTGYDADGKPITECKTSPALTLAAGTYRVKVGGDAACVYMCGGVALKVVSG